MISFTEAEILAWLTPLLWPFIRALALFSALPVFSARSVPVRVRIALAAFIAIAAQASMPPIAPELLSLALDTPLAFMLVLQQVLIGLTLGFAVRVVFAAVELAGELIGLQMGLNFAGFFDPVTASQGTATARFFATTLEPFAFLLKAQPHRWGAEIFATGLWIALPLIAMLLFVNLVLGLISRVASQINIFAVGFPVTLGVGLVGMFLTLPMMQAPFMMALERVLAQMR